MAAWASVKTVIRSGAVCLREADSSDPCENGALRIVGFLVVAHVGFDAHPGLPTMTVPNVLPPTSDGTYGAPNIQRAFEGHIL